MKPRGADKYKTFRVTVQIHEIINNDFEGFLDLLCKKVGNPLLMDISYKIIKAKHTTIELEVFGDDSERTSE